jgi:hypothetical protein
MSQNYVGIWAGFVEIDGKHGKTAQLEIYTENIAADSQSDAEIKFNAYCTANIHPKWVQGQPVKYMVLPLTAFEPAAPNLIPTPATPLAPAVPPAPKV